MIKQQAFDIHGNFSNKELEQHFLEDQWFSSKSILTKFPLLFTGGGVVFIYADFMRNYIIDERIGLAIIIILRFLLLGLALLLYSKRIEEKKPKHFDLIIASIRLLMAIVVQLTVLLSPGSLTLYFTIIGLIICFYIMPIKNFFETIFSVLLIIASGILNYPYVSQLFSGIQTIVYLQLLGIVLLSFVHYQWKIQARKTYLYRKQLQQLLSSQEQLFAIFGHDISNPLSVLKVHIESISRHASELSKDKFNQNF